MRFLCTPGVVLARGTASSAGSAATLEPLTSPPWPVAPRWYFGQDFIITPFFFFQYTYLYTQAANVPGLARGIRLFPSRGRRVVSSHPRRTRGGTDLCPGSSCEAVGAGVARCHRAALSLPRLSGRGQGLKRCSAREGSRTHQSPRNGGRGPRQQQNKLELNKIKWGALVSPTSPQSPPLQQTEKGKDLISADLFACSGKKAVAEGKRGSSWSQGNNLQEGRVKFFTW